MTLQTWSLSYLAKQGTPFARDTFSNAKLLDQNPRTPGIRETFLTGRANPLETGVLPDHLRGLTIYTEKQSWKWKTFTLKMIIMTVAFIFRFRTAVGNCDPKAWTKRKPRPLAPLKKPRWIFCKCEDYVLRCMILPKHLQVFSKKIKVLAHDPHPRDLESPLWIPHRSWYRPKDSKGSTEVNPKNDWCPAEKCVSSAYLIWWVQAPRAAPFHEERHQQNRFNWMFSSTAPPSVTWLQSGRVVSRFVGQIGWELQKRGCTV